MNSKAFTRGSARGPWSKVPKQSADNLCVEGHLVPSVYLLGAAKSATTSMAANLMGAGVEVAGPDCRGWCESFVKHYAQQKELHYFDFKMNWDMHTLQDYERERQDWVGMFPSCDRPDGLGARLIQAVFPQMFPLPKRRMADFTPEYLRMVPLPEGSIYDEKSMVHTIFGGASDTDKAHMNLPNILKTFYGQDADKITFMVMLRDPLERMQSLYYCCLCPPDDKDIDPECLKSNFEQDLRKDLEKLTEQPPRFSDWVWGSFYSQHLSGWLQYFNPSQFYVVPFRTFTEQDGDGLCGDLSQRMGYEMECNGNGTQATWLEHEHPHPPLSEDISKAAHDAYGQLMAEELKNLSELLAQIHQEGGGLAGFSGTSDPATIGAWLHSNW